MPSGNYDRLRHRLDEQLRADVELLYEAYLTRLRALETVARAQGELDDGARKAPIPLSLPPPAAGSRLDLQPADAAPVPAPPPKSRKSRAYDVYHAADDALAKVGDIFDKQELCAALGFEPKRATLYRVLQELVEDRAIAVHKYGTGKQPTRYRKLVAAKPAKDAGDQS